MKYTKEQLQAMSDFEIGKSLAIECGKVIASEQYFHYGDRDENVVLLFPAGESFNINNPADIMPLAFKHNISIISGDGGKTWWAEYATEINHQFIMCSKQSCQDVSPLRAIACCLILVLQGEK